MNRKPNIILIITDQQHAGMLSCAGNKYVHTPAMDNIASMGTRFEKAYCTHPICSPSRFSLFTGRMPSEINMRGMTALIETIPTQVRNNGLGHLLRNAGYNTVYGGKQNFPRMTAADLGFDVISTDERETLANDCAEFIKTQREEPYFLVASFINPHDICYMAIRDFQQTEEERKIIQSGKKPLEALDEALTISSHMTRTEFIEAHCPPLPDNFLPQQDEPEIIEEMLKSRPFRYKARMRYRSEQWRMHRWAYARLTERVDRQVGIVLDALESSGQLENTVIVFTSDHGDMDSAHGMEHKTVFYEESTRIPLIVVSPNAPQAQVNTTQVVSNGLDLVPTILAYAGVTAPDDLQGQCLKSLVDGDGTAFHRDYVPIENEIGSMVVTGRFKYALFDHGEHREQLYDLMADPGEMRNFARDEAYADILHEHRELFRKQWPDKFNL